MCSFTTGSHSTKWHINTTSKLLSRSSLLSPFWVEQFYRTTLTFYSLSFHLFPLQFLYFLLLISFLKTLKKQLKDPLNFMGRSNKNIFWEKIFKGDVSLSLITEEEDQSEMTEYTLEDAQKVSLYVSSFFFKMTSKESRKGLTDAFLLLTRSITSFYSLSLSPLTVRRDRNRSLIVSAQAPILRRFVHNVCAPLSWLLLNFSISRFERYYQIWNCFENKHCTFIFFNKTNTISFRHSRSSIPCRWLTMSSWSLFEISSGPIRSQPISLHFINKSHCEGCTKEEHNHQQYSFWSRVCKVRGEETFPESNLKFACPKSKALTPEKSSLDPSR